MRTENLSLTEAFGLGELDIIRAHLVDHVAACPKHKAGDGRQGKRDDRQYPRTRVSRSVGSKDRRKVEQHCAEIPEEVDISQRRNRDNEDDIDHTEFIRKFVFSSRHEKTEGQTQRVGKDHGDNAHAEGRSDHRRLVSVDFVVRIVIRELLCVHSVEDSLVLERSEIDA